jgi:excisionase family DNA binding protein
VRMPEKSVALLTVEEASRRLGVSVSTVWRQVRRGSLRSLRQHGRRYVPEDAVQDFADERAEEQVPPLTSAHPIFRLVGAGRGGGRAPGARDKHDVLAE